MPGGCLISYLRKYLGVINVIFYFFYTFIISLIFLIVEVVFNPINYHPSTVSFIYCVLTFFVLVFLVWRFIFLRKQLYNLKNKHFFIMKDMLILSALSIWMYIIIDALMDWKYVVPL